MNKTLYSPYQEISENQRWRNVLKNVGESTSPHYGSQARFGFDKNTLITSAGSCFAQRISESLKKNGLNYLILENAPEYMDAEIANRYNYGIYSARYGNIYSPLQMLQLLNRSIDKFTPIEKHWAAEGGGVIDPFRPAIQPSGYATFDELHADRINHLQAVREVFERAEIFVFTLGLTEIWRDKRDGSVYPVCPGRGLGTFDPAIHYFENRSLAKTIEDLENLIQLLQNLNDRLKIILTVSPVPLIATYEPRNIIQANTYSKSILRVAAEEMRIKYDNVDYFASYEIITQCYRAHEYFEPDGRAISPSGVDRVLETFYRHFCYEKVLNRVCEDVYSKELDAIICDEDELGLFLEKERAGGQ